MPCSGLPASVAAREGTRTRSHLEVVQARELGPVPARQAAHALDDDVDVNLLRARLVTLFVDKVKSQAPLGGVFVPDRRGELVTVAQEALKLVLCGDALKVLEDFGPVGIEVTPSWLRRLPARQWL